MADEDRKLRILMFPYIAYGHMTAFFELAKKLSDRGFSIDFCSTPINLSFIKKIFPDKYSSSIQLVELHLPNLPQLPPHFHTTNGLPLHLKPTLFKALKMARPQFHQILKAQKPHLLIYDVLQLWPAAVASTLNIPAMMFYTLNAAAFSYFLHFVINPGVEFPFPDLYLRDYEQKTLVSGETHDEEAAEVDRDSDEIFLVNSSRAIDAKYMDYLSETGQAKLVPVGGRQQLDVDMEEETQVFKWLGKKKEHSTVFVSFGSEYFLTKEEIEEVAYGLELSNVCFIWAVRFQDDELPQGFLERIGERGWIVEGWAPQARILRNQSIGAFVTHCGWNSALESIEFGVPIIAIPMLYDQPLNARFMVENGVAVEVPRHENGKLNRLNIAEKIKQVMGEETGEEMRRKVSILGEDVRLRRDQEMDGVVEAITHVYEKSLSSLM